MLPNPNVIFVVRTLAGLACVAMVLGTVRYLADHDQVQHIDKLVPLVERILQ